MGQVDITLDPRHKHLATGVGPATGIAEDAQKDNQKQCRKIVPHVAMILDSNRGGRKYSRISFGVATLLIRCGGSYLVWWWLRSHIISMSIGEISP
jgi:hypothetical protein